MTDDLVKRLRRSVLSGYADLDKLLDDAADRIEALEREREWRPIETAPRDGTPMLIWQPDGERSHYMPTGALKDGEFSYLLDDPRLQWFDDSRFAIGYWRPWAKDGDKHPWGNRNASWPEPTHWLPLPQPPEDK